MLQLPKTIRVGYQTCKVICGEYMDDTQGCYTTNTGDIVINSRDGNVEMVNTVLHEALHAVTHNYGMREIIDDEDKEEYIVTTLGNALTQVFLDNPALLDWIKENLHNANVIL